MAKYKYVLLSILSFILLPISIKGAVCPDSEKVNYQSLAKNISYSYDYVEENESVHFNVTFVNIPEGFYLKDLNSKQAYNYSGSEMTINNLEQGKNLKYGVYTTSIGCDGILLYTHYITLPYYNPYYKDELCNGVKNFMYCNKWVNKQITYEEFKGNIEKYKNKVNSNNIVEEEDNDFNVLNIIVDFYLKYYFIILPVIIIIGVIVIKNYNKEQDLF